MTRGQVCDFTFISIAVCGILAFMWNNGTHIYGSPLFLSLRNLCISQLLLFAIKVIGNKEGGHTSELTPSEVLRFLEKLQEVTGIPTKLIHVVRNPFDNIATIALRFANHRNTVRDNTTKVNTICSKYVVDITGKNNVETDRLDTPCDRQEYQRPGLDTQTDRQSKEAINWTLAWDQAPHVGLRS